MKLEEFLNRYPWAKTREALCGEPTEQTTIPMSTAEQLIVGQRESQREVLQSLMLSPVLEPAAAVTETAHPREQVFELRAPRRTARLFLDRATRAGKDLRPLRTADLDQLEYGVSRLGRLLRLLAISQDASVAERARMVDEWWLLASEYTDVGLVLTPMLYAPPGTSGDADIQRLTHELADNLASVDVSKRASGKTLQSWTASLVREGSRRLRELGAPKIERRGGTLVVADVRRHRLRRDEPTPL
jgi:hypothetical protein